MRPHLIAVMEHLPARRMAIAAGLLPMLALEACSNGSITSALAPSSFGASSRPAGVSRNAGSCPCIYVANASGTNSNPSITVYPISARGNAKPLQYISGTKTTLAAPTDVAVDADDNVYVVN